MTGREQKLSLVAGVLAVAIVALTVGYRVFVKPIREAARQRLALAAELSKLEQLENRARVAVNQLKKVAQRTHGDNPEAVVAAIGKRITGIIKRTGLDERQFTRLPLMQRPEKGALEIGWSVQGSGPMEEVVSLLYLLDAEPYVHRIESLSISSRDRRGSISASFKFLTLVLDPPLAVERTPFQNEERLDSTKRKLFDGIAIRDIFRPYVKRAATPPAKPAPHPPARPAPRPEQFKVVSLSQWKNTPEILVLDSKQNKVVEYRVGDELAGGTVVAVDYRVLASPKDANLKSESRIILREGGRYWAIEGGGTFADKYHLTTDRLPPDLPDKVAGAQ